MPMKKIQEIIDAGDTAMTTDGDFSKALLLYQSAESMLVQHKGGGDDGIILRRSVLEKMASALVSIGDQEGALENYKISLNLVMGQLQKLGDNNNNKTAAAAADHHESIADLYLTMGQLSCDYDALESYQTGISNFEQSIEIRQQLSSNDDDKQKVLLEETKRKLAIACSTIAELYLTDLCFEENAEQECESYVQRSLDMIDNEKEDSKEEEEDPNSMQQSSSSTASFPPDPYQIAASLRLSQQKIPQASNLILRTYETMKVGCEALSQLVGLNENDKNQSDTAAAASASTAKELVNVEEAENLPTFEFRCQTAKLLLECACSTSSNDQEEEDDDNNKNTKNQCLSAGIHVLGSLLAENDEVAEIWYLIGCTYFAFGDNKQELARHYLERSQEMLQAIQSSLGEQKLELEQAPPNDDEQEEMMDEDEDDNHDDENEKDDEIILIQQQLDDVQIQLEEVQLKLSELDGETIGAKRPQPPPDMEEA